MRKAKAVCLLAVLLMAGLASARTVWSPTDPNVIKAGYSNWNVAENWIAGVPVLELEATNTAGKAVFYGDKPECQITTPDAVCWYFVLGDTEEMTKPLRIMDGGTLTTGANWSGVGYNKPATLIVEEGGTLSVGGHLWVASNSGGVGTVIVNGGTILVKDAFDWGHNDGAFGYITLNSGLIEARYQDTSSRGLMDIRFGTLRFTGGENSDRDGMLARISEGSMVGFGGLSTVNVELINGMWTATAISPMNPSPGYESMNPDGNVKLSWTNMAPATEGGPVYVDVWFGTNSEAMSLVEGVSGVANIDYAVVNAPVAGDPPTQYYWKVDSYIYGDPAVVAYDSNDLNPNSYPVIEGDVFTFFVTNDFAPTVVIDTPDTVTWSNEPVQLDATIIDSGDSPVHIEWTSSDASTVFTDPATGLENPTVEDPIVVVGNAAGNVTLTATVWDELNTDRSSATMLLAVYANACQATRVGAGMAAQYPMDTNGDCTVGIEDVATIAGDWLTDYALQEAIIIP